MYENLEVIYIRRKEMGELVATSASLMGIIIRGHRI